MSTPASLPASLCVIVSHYDARPIEPLVGLLRSLKALGRTRGEGVESFEVVLKAVVNSIDGREPQLPPDLAEIEVLVRPNAGFNMGAWDHGWRRHRGHRHYLFLQDECELRQPLALERYWQLLEAGQGRVVVGESLQPWRTWQAYARSWPEHYAQTAASAAAMRIDLGAAATHLQTLAVGASNAALQRMDGFLLADEKLAAIATEVLFSRRAVMLGLRLRQSAWGPFACFRHEQWDHVAARSHTLRWNASKLLWILGYAWRDQAPHRR